MKRTNFHLTDNQIESLRKKSLQCGLSVAELIRRAIDEYMKNITYEAKKTKIVDIIL